MGAKKFNRRYRNRIWMGGDENKQDVYFSLEANGLLRTRSFPLRRLYLPMTQLRRAQFQEGHVMESVNDDVMDASENNYDEGDRRSV